MKFRRPFLLTTLCAFISLTGFSPAWAEEATIAVAANFAITMEELETDFEATTGHELTVVTGSTGRLYAQIIHGAPFDIFLAADTHRPGLLIEQGHAIAESHFTYATGILALWSTDPHLIDEYGLPGLILNHQIDKLAIANPALAPYGEAAQHVLNTLNPDQTQNVQIVMGENVGQAFLLTATGNTQAGLVSLSQIIGNEDAQSGSWWAFPEGQHPPIHQDAVLLNRASENPAAQAFMVYLTSDQARTIILAQGYRAFAS